jgi:hypothetical protein
MSKRSSQRIYEGFTRPTSDTSINGRRIESPSQLRDAVKNAKGSVALLVRRAEAQIFVPSAIDLSYID